MTPPALKALETRLEHFLCDLTAPLGRRERRHGAQVSVQGWLLDGERNSLEPMASRLPGADVQALRPCVGQRPWAVEAGQRRLAQKVVDLLGDPAVWIIDETAVPKAGTHAVGGARHYCGTLGQVANCQVAIRLHGRRADARCPLTWRRYWPTEGSEGEPRAAPVKVPPGTLSQGEAPVAWDLSDQVRTWEVPILPVVADACCGNECGFRPSLRQRPLPSVVEVESRTGVWTEAPHVPWPPPNKTGRPRQFPPLEALPRPKSLQTVAQELRPRAGKPGTWREGSRGPQRSGWSLLQVWASQGRREQSHPERVVEWLLVEWPQGVQAPVKDWLAPLAGPLPGLRRVVRLAKARRRLEVDDRQRQEARGLDHAEGRHGLGWPHHACLVSVAEAFWRSEQARIQKNSWGDLASREEAPASPAD